MTGGGPAFVAGLRWAVEQGFDVVNLSLSTRKRASWRSSTTWSTPRTSGAPAGRLGAQPRGRELALALRGRLSVATHGGEDPLEYHYNPQPPVESSAVASTCAGVARRRARDRDGQLNWPPTSPGSWPGSGPSTRSSRRSRSRPSCSSPPGNRDRSVLRRRRRRGLAAAAARRELLQSIVEVARAILVPAATVAVLDEAAGDFVSRRWPAPARATSWVRASGPGRASQARLPPPASRWSWTTCAPTAASLATSRRTRATCPTR